ncbi:formin-like protein 6 [Oryza brachyantha]|uniref:formin-like protein 6 n=1 Tax=Oryza brachyantha TaxID=4533 RepID=UPI001ADB7A55|nr:formin-like protein 6 [Oryza brachyantha]
MSLFRRLFHRRPPEGLVEISGNIFVFDHCFSTDFFEEDELKPYIGGILKQLLGRYSIDSFMVFNFEGGKKDNQIASIFSDFEMSVMGYPRNYEGCPLLTMEMIHHFVRSSESWLSLGQENFLLIHSEQGGWPVLAFALAALLVYLRRSNNEGKALEMVYRQAPPGLVEHFSPLDPAPSQLRYLKYVSRRHISPDLWPPADRMMNLNCVIIRGVPNFDGKGGCRPIFQIYGPDPFVPGDRSTKVLFSTPKTSDFVELYTQEDSEIIKFNARCPVQGDVVMECISLDENFEHEVMVFRVMFNTAFIEDNLLLLGRDQIDILWDTKHRFPVDFRVEVIFSEMDTITSLRTSQLSSEDKESFYRVEDAFSHVEWSTKSNHVTTDATEQNRSNSKHDGFDVIPLQETESSNTTSENNLLGTRSVQVIQIETEHNHYSAPKFEGVKDAVADEHSLPEPNSLASKSQERELFEDSSAGELPKWDTTKNNLDPELPSTNSRDPEAAGDAAVAEWSDTNTDTFLSDTPSSSSPSSPPKFDEDSMEAGTVEIQTQPAEPQRC